MQAKEQDNIVQDSL